MNIEVIRVEHVVAYANRADCVEVVAEFSHLPGQFLPFLASLHDTEAHGRDIYQRAIAGEFGEIEYHDVYPLTPAVPTLVACVMEDPHAS